MKKSVVPPIDFHGESNLHSPEPPQPSVPKGDTSCLQHFYNICKKYKPKLKVVRFKTK